MKIFQFELRKVPDLKASILNQAEENAKAGLIKAELELRHHLLLLRQLLRKEVTEEQAEAHTREIRLTEEAIERDNKSINNWRTQLKAIEYERI